MDPVIVSLLIIALCLACLMIYRRFFAGENIWKNAGIPYNSGFKTSFFLVKMFRTPLHELILQNYRKAGNLSGGYMFGKPQLQVKDPEILRQVLVKDFQFFIDRVYTESGDKMFDNVLSFLTGDKWKRVRTIMSPTFSTGKIKRMVSTILECSETLQKNFDTAAKSGKPVDVKRLFGAFTMDAIASTAFSTKVDSFNDPDNPFVKAAREVFSMRNQVKMLMTFFMARSLMKLLRIKTDNLFASNFFGAITLKLIEERKNSKHAKKNDFLQLMIEASEKGHDSNDSEFGDKANGKTVADKSTPDPLKNGSSGETVTNYKGLSEDELVAQCVLFFVGGFETVASTIAFTIYELALNEDCQEKVIKEIDETLRENENKLNYENIQTMKYLDCVVSETLRMYPPALSLQRIATSDCTIGDMNLKIPKGTIIAIPIYGLHYDPVYFPEPEKFDPNRFTPEEKALRNPYVYLPFGAGPRNCIAMRFALMEVKLCIAHVLSHFRFHRCSETQVPLKFPKAQTQLQASDIYLTVEKRKDTVF